MNRRRLLGSSLIGAFDQAVLSAFSLAVGVLFIKYASKEEYAAYALLMTLLLLAQALQNALVNSPMTTLAPRADTRSQERVLQTAQRLQAGAVLVLMLLCVVVGVFLVLTRASDPWLAVSMALAGAGMLWREFARARHFLAHQPVRALAADAVYAAVGLTAVLGLLWFHRVEALFVLGAVGLAGLLGGLGAGMRFRWPFRRTTNDERADLRAFWDCSKWALPSVLNSWLQANAFLFVVQALLSKAEVADLSATRLLIMPLSLLAVGWSNAFRPRATALHAAGQTVAIDRIAAWSVGGFVAVGALYGAALWVCMPLLTSMLLGSKYSGLGGVTAAWLLFFVVVSVRGVGMACMLASPKAFRMLYFYGCAALAVALPFVVLACLLRSPAGVVLALAAGEAVHAMLIWGRGWPLLRADAGRG